MPALRPRREFVRTCSQRDAFFGVDLWVVRRLDQVTGSEVPGSCPRQRIFEDFGELADE